MSRNVTFDEYNIAKINQYQWKELLKNMKSTIFDGKRLKTRESIQLSEINSITVYLPFDKFYTV